MNNCCHSCHRSHVDADACANTGVLQGRAREQSGGSASSAAAGPPTPGRGAALMEQISWCEEDNHFPTISPNDWELDLSALEVSSLRSTMHRLMLQSPYRHLRARAFGNDMLCLRVTLALAGCCACRLDAWLLWQ